MRGDPGTPTNSFMVTLALLEKAYFFCKDFIYLLLERGVGREKERERNINVWLPVAHPLLGTWPAAQACDLTGNQTGNSMVDSPYSNH